jgi:hypothetical protein
MFQIKKYFILIFVLLFMCTFTGNIQNSNAQSQTLNKKSKVNSGSLAYEKSEEPRPVLAISPREIDIGTIGPGDLTSGVFTFKNMTSGIMGWSTYGPEGWKIVENQKLSSVVKDDADYLRMEIRVLPNEQPANGNKPKKSSYLAEMKLEAGNGKLICQKIMSAGAHKEAIKITSVGGLRTIFVTFKIVSTLELAQINLNPLRIDMGCLLSGKTMSKKIRLTNKGKEMLKWTVEVPKQKRTDAQIDTFKKGRFIAFVNEETKENGAYYIPGHLKESLDMIGKWVAADGYPASTGGPDSFKFSFNGTGVSIYFTKYPSSGNLTIYLDDRLINEHKWFADQKENIELLVAENMADGPHVLTFVNKEGHLDIEGVKILGKDITRGPAGWITIFPNSGSTTLETEYINVTLNTVQLMPGLYSDNIVFNSNGGEGIVEVFVEVISDKTSKTIDIYRYAKNLDYLFTANPQVESKRLSQNAYVKEGIAFRLFVPETPGTTNFYRWYNPQKKDHFYHYDPQGGGKQLQGYVLEGSIGNIATSRMTNTKELYRWFNSANGHYFYTIDPKGESIAKKGYRFDGIAGYVK